MKQIIQKSAAAAQWMRAVRLRNTNVMSGQITLPFPGLQFKICISENEDMKTAFADIVLK